jgi:hypothetical protein
VVEPQPTSPWYGGSTGALLKLNQRFISRFGAKNRHWSVRGDDPETQRGGVVPKRTLQIGHLKPDRSQPRIIRQTVGVRRDSIRVRRWRIGTPGATIFRSQYVLPSEGAWTISIVSAHRSVVQRSLVQVVRKWCKSYSPQISSVLVASARRYDFTNPPFTKQG